MYNEESWSLVSGLLLGQNKPSAKVKVTFS